MKVREVETSIQEEYVNKTIDSIDSNFQSKSNSSGIAWQLINQLTNRKQKSTDLLPGYKNKDERAQAWISHYSSLLYNPSININMDNLSVSEPQLDINTDPLPFTQDWRWTHDCS